MSQHKFEVKAPDRFNMTTVIIINLLAMLPLCILYPLLLIVGLNVPSGFWGVPFGVWFVLLCGMCLLYLWFFPGLGGINYYTRRFVSQMFEGSGETGYICQVTMQPRLYRGIRAFLEDADDIGLVTLNDGVLKFRGDHSDIAITLSTDVTAELRTIGWRGLWYSGARIRLTFPGREPFHEIEFLERQCWSVKASKRLAQELYAKIQQATRGTGNSPGFAGPN